MRLAMIMIGGLALSGCVQSAEMRASEQARASRDLAEALAGRTAGAPVDCISATRVNGPDIIDRRTILYRDGGRVYRNDLAAECPGLEPRDAIIIELHGSQICRNDQFRELSPGSSIPGPYCRLGSFVPYDKP